ncbi:MAG: fumarylacetoacetate hydrolase family protein [Bacteroidales bacterium OttesenSCG-928-I14]|nr:fumarylacetoacetate hydrolase family protein [Bacteroidales bacterium OttesenSCG-928-I14]
MKIICVASNYRTQSDDVNKKLKVNDPIIFMKSDTSLLKNGDPFCIPNFSSKIQYEAEIVVRISQFGKNIPYKLAYQYFNEVTIGIDMTAKDLQSKFSKIGLPWELYKSFDNSAVIGTLVKIKKFKWDINQMLFRLDINKNTVQKGNTLDMIFSVSEIIEYVSQFVTLKIGDLIFTGTPIGIGDVNINDHFQGYIENEKLLDFYIK